MRKPMLIVVVAAVAALAGCGEKPMDPVQQEAQKAQAGFVVIGFDDQVAVPVFDEVTMILDARVVIRAVEIYLQANPTAGLTE